VAVNPLGQTEHSTTITVGEKPIETIKKPEQEPQEKDEVVEEEEKQPVQEIEQITSEEPKVTEELKETEREIYCEIKYNRNDVKKNTLYRHKLTTFFYIITCINDVIKKKKLSLLRHIYQLFFRYYYVYK
jgi:flagellar biosynthesis GTPase FlhF